MCCWTLISIYVNVNVWLEVWHKATQRLTCPSRHLHPSDGRYTAVCQYLTSTAAAATTTSQRHDTRQLQPWNVHSGFSYNSVTSSSILNNDTQLDPSLQQSHHHFIQHYAGIPRFNCVQINVSQYPSRTGFLPKPSFTYSCIFLVNIVINSPKLKVLNLT